MRALLIGIAGFSFACVGCTVLTDLDRFRPASGDAGGMDAHRDVDAGKDGGTDSGGRSFVLRLRNFGDYPRKKIEARLIANNSNKLLARAIGVLPDGVGDADIVMPGAATQSGLRVDLWIDNNDNSTLDDTSTDPQWRYELPENGMILVEFNPAYTSIRDPGYVPIGGGVMVRVEGFDREVGRIMETRVIARHDAGEEITVGLVRAPLKEPTIAFDIGDIVDDSLEYQVDMFADINMNGRYDPPPSDHAWHSTIVTLGGGNIVARFRYSEDYVDVMFENPP